ncbi:hypothetical protein EW026_g991 [Hermanssonia centrifuga]|uniref:stearoyl-CoA 9-desaturase n=1 Tax=Hermanssonia centrifuga TaxID=98765 RepID=A0A4S4KTX6_9APHY|nr:hypothetical protein EW026_g991 [Hermanssonia centrifuga]
MDYRNAVKWYQWDPTKWFIAVCSYLGAASHLRVFPDVEVTRSQLTMKLKQLKTELDSLPWPVASDDLPIISWESYQEQSKERSLVLVSGFIHDVNDFVDQHPGGQGILQAYIGRDATPAFFGGVYDHSNAAHNLLASMRVGALHGGLEQINEDAVPPCQKLQVVSRVAGYKSE